MAILLEGNDGAGKSTLANKFGYEIYRAGGPPTSLDEAVACLEAQRSLFNKKFQVLDRCTFISDGIYRPHMVITDYDIYLERFLLTPFNVLVYCRPSDPDKALRLHKIEDYDTEEMIQRVVENYHKHADAYDQFMQYYPHIVYDWMDESQDALSFVNMIKSWISSGYGWHQYIRIAMTGTIYARHPLLNKMIDDMGVIMIFGPEKSPTALLYHNESKSYEVKPL